MFNIPNLFSIVLKHSNKAIWSDRKKVSMGLTVAIHQDSLAYLADTAFNKLFTGQNKGRTLYGVVQDGINEKGFSTYILQAEKRLGDSNYKESKFLLFEVLEDTFDLLEQSQNLPKSIRLGLEQSYTLYHADRPYLFLAECLFCALVCQHHKHQEYLTVDFSQETEVVSKPLEELVSRATGYSKRIIQELNRFSEEELQLFKKIAPFTFYDESYDELSDDYILDYYLISHEDFIDLFQKYGVSGNDISRLKEYGLISGGGRHEMFVEKGELSGFQNDNLVLTFTTDSDERITFEYSAFHLTDTAKALIEILEIETDDEFFRELTESFKKKLSSPEIIIEVYGIENLE
ncbi:TPA: hypothetical protein TVQ98_001514 [Streptococcus equi subsp. zooepidemicus]|nr:hypothetical protein [Streptococcus equi subsp. zooepidemicus]HEL0713366.1 hypothetical protein [Streptococcus equi subsp. zooepidemicus]HEL0737636.1 hypothetical protein [Streptococcus equi subsp. zooepidemicus]HEL0768840.1 hypothetical protein [Streptococcus equi subsp. zooepidemicus]HEL1302681.1 hypothetical protein [Streptococcus equi subsp. zooepidemicus]